VRKSGRNRTVASENHTLESSPDQLAINHWEASAPTSEWATAINVTEDGVNHTGRVAIYLPDCSGTRPRWTNPNCLKTQGLAMEAVLW